jgi:hypothetical protein
LLVLIFYLGNLLLEAPVLLMKFLSAELVAP